MQKQLRYAVSLSDFIPCFTTVTSTATSYGFDNKANLPPKWGYNRTLIVLKSTTRPNFSTNL